MLKFCFECPDVARQRSHDRNIQRRVTDYLSFRGIEGLQLVRINVNRGNVVLSGIVSSLSAKRRLCECCRSVAGVVGLNENLVVVPSSWHEKQTGFREPASTSSLARIKNSPLVS